MKNCLILLLALAVFGCSTSASGGGGSSSVTGVSLDHASAVVPVGTTCQLTASVTPSDASQAVTWSTSDAARATVSTTGLVTGVSSGTVVITATTVSGSKDASCDVAVTPPALLSAWAGTYASTSGYGSGTISDWRLYSDDSSTGMWTNSGGSLSLSGTGTYGLSGTSYAWTVVGIATNPSATPTTSPYTGTGSGTLTSTGGTGTYSITFTDWVGISDAGTWSVTALAGPTRLSSWIVVATPTGGTAGSASIGLYSDNTLSLWWAVGTSQSVTGSGTYTLNGSGAWNAAVKVEELAGLLTRSGMNTIALKDARGAQWTKLIFNASTNPVGALTLLHHGAATRFAPTAQLFNDLISEGEAVAKKLGIELHGDPRQLVQKGANAPGKHRASMLQDVLAKRQTEVDFMNGAIVQWGEKVGVPTPLNKALWQLVKGLEHAWKDPE